MRWLLVTLFLMGAAFLAAVVVYGLVVMCRSCERRGWKVKGLSSGRSSVTNVPTPECVAGCDSPGVLMVAVAIRACGHPHD